MKKLMMMTACAAMVMSATAALVATDADHNLTGVYYADYEQVPCHLVLPSHFPSQTFTRPVA